MQVLPCSPNEIFWDNGKLFRLNAPFRPILNRTYSAEITDKNYRNLRHQRIIKQLPHILGQDVRSRATVIILHLKAHYKENRVIFRKMSVEFFGFYGIYFMQY